MGIETGDVANGVPLIGKALEQRGLEHVVIGVETVPAWGLVWRKAGVTHLPAPERRCRHTAEARYGANLVHRHTIWRFFTHK